ncbi:MAG: helix-turn-helix transcriptional regulator [Stellaceae bacterium]
MPESAVRTFTDPDAYFGGIRNLSIDGLVTGRGKFRAETTLVNLHRLHMGRFDEDLPRIMRVTPSGSRSVILFQTDPGRPGTVANAIDTAQHPIAMFGLDWPYYVRSSAGSGWGTMSLIPEDLAAAGRAIIGRELMPPEFMLAIRRPPVQPLSRLLKLHEATGHLAKNAPDILAKREVARAIEEALVEAMVLCLAADYSEEVRNAHRHRARVMRRLEDTLRAKSGETLYMDMAELCAAVGATYWTLRDCCLEYLGMSPKRYLWMRRMNLARLALSSANPEKTTVTEIATNYGFWELGRFSVTYRSLFGEPPSAALRRPP